MAVKLNYNTDKFPLAEKPKGKVVEPGWEGGGVGGGGGILAKCLHFFLLVGVDPSPRRTLRRLQGSFPHPLVADKTVPLCSFDQLQTRAGMLTLAFWNLEVFDLPVDPLS